MPEAKRILSFLDDGNFALVEGWPTNPIPTSELIAAEPPEQKFPDAKAIIPPATHIPFIPEGAKMLVDTLNLSEGITVQFQWPSTISKETYEDFLYQLEGFKRRIHRSVKDAEPGSVLGEAAGNTQA